MSAPLVFQGTDVPVRRWSGPIRGNLVAAISDLYAASDQPIRGTLWERVSETERTIASPRVHVLAGHIRVLRATERRLDAPPLPLEVYPSMRRRTRA